MFQKHVIQSAHILWFADANRFRYYLPCGCLRVDLINVVLLEKVRLLRSVNAVRNDRKQDEESSHVGL